MTARTNNSKSKSNGNGKSNGKCNSNGNNKCNNRFPTGMTNKRTGNDNDKGKGKEKAPRERWASRWVDLYNFYFIRLGITTMPLGEKVLLLCFVVDE